MRDWRTYWNAVLPAATPEQLLRQVGKTVNGIPVTEESLDSIVESIVRALELTDDDALLDLCCGNGLLTFRSAQRCREVTAVDYSQPLIDTAKRFFTRHNITYTVADVTRLPEAILRRPYNKISMYEALQHFSTEEADELLRSLRGSASRDAPLFLGSVPDASRIWSYYDTPERRADYELRTREGLEAIGHWWNADQLRDLAARHGYAMKLTPSDARLYTSHYRFDVLLTPE